MKPCTIPGKNMYAANRDHGLLIDHLQYTLTHPHQFSRESFHISNGLDPRRIDSLRITSGHKGPSSMSWKGSKKGLSATKNVHIPHTRENSSLNANAVEFVPLAVRQSQQPQQYLAQCLNPGQVPDPPTGKILIRISPKAWLICFSPRVNEWTIWIRTRPILYGECNSAFDSCTDTACHFSWGLTASWNC